MNRVGRMPLLVLLGGALLLPFAVPMPMPKTKASKTPPMRNSKIQGRKRPLSKPRI